MTFSGIKLDTKHWPVMASWTIKAVGAIVAILFVNLESINCQTNKVIACGKPFSELQGIQPEIDTYHNEQRRLSPWHVAIFRFRRDYLQDSYIYSCGGTLIPGRFVSETYVITAASCVTETRTSFEAMKKKEHLRVVTGPVSWNYNTNSKETGSASYKVANIRVHPLYDPVRNTANLALIRLDRFIDQSLYAVPACMHPYVRSAKDPFEVMPGTLGEMASFAWDSDKNITNETQFMSYRVMSPEGCRQERPIKVNEFLQFCSATVNSTQDASLCNRGDFGGAFITQENGYKFVQGILTNTDKRDRWSENKCNQVHLFTRASPYTEWIENVLYEFSKEADSEDSQLEIKRPPPRAPLQDYVAAAADIQNRLRSNHQAPPLQVNRKMQQEAQKLSQILLTVRTPRAPQNSPFSWNIFYAPGKLGRVEAVQAAMDYWYGGFIGFNKNDPRPSAFTQMIWRSSKAMGVGVATDGERTVVAVNYFPKGNILYREGKFTERFKYYNENVHI